MSTDRSPGEPGTRFVVVANDDAGSSDDDALGSAEDVLAGAGEVERVTLEDLPAAGDDPSVLIAAGGDGTVHALVQRLHERGTLADRRLAVLPLGTANDFARANGIPLDPTAAAAVIARGRDERRDLLVGDDGTVVVNAAHVGLGAAAGRRASDLKPRLGHLAYPLGAVIEGMAADGAHLDVRVGTGGGGEVQRLGGDDVLYLGVANSARIGGGHEVHPHASVDDGRLAVLVLHDPGLLGRVPAAWRAARGTLPDSPDVEVAHGSWVEVRGAGSRWDVDGEHLDPRRSWRLMVLPGAWSLRVPT